MFSARQAPFFHFATPNDLPPLLEPFVDHMIATFSTVSGRRPARAGYFQLCSGAVRLLGGRRREGALAEVVAHSVEHAGARPYARLNEALFVVFNKAGHFALGQPGGSGDTAQRPPMRISKTGVSRDSATADHCWSASPAALDQRPDGYV